MSRYHIFSLLEKMIGINLAQLSALHRITLVFLQLLVDGEDGVPSAPAIP